MDNSGEEDNIHNSFLLGLSQTDEIFVISTAGKKDIEFSKYTTIISIYHSVITLIASHISPDP